MAQAAAEVLSPAPIDWSGLSSHVSPSPTNWRLVHGNRDIYYRRAKESGYRARSAYKLLQVDAAHRLFLPSTRRVVDLCAAPGSWSQVAAERLAASAPPSSTPRVIAVDLQEMSPIPGVQLLQGDVTAEATMTRILQYCGGEPVELVLCDGAPDVTGLHVIDEYVQGQLLESVLRLTVRMMGGGRHLRGQGVQGRGLRHAQVSRCTRHIHAGAAWRSSLLHTSVDSPYVAFLLSGPPVRSAQLSVFFRSVDCVKPASSRMKSAEHFVVCKGFHLPRHYRLSPLQPRGDAEDKAAEEQSGIGSGEEATHRRQLTRAIDGYLQRGELRPASH